MTKRIIYFSIGLLMGVVFLAFFFKGKGTEFCYLPNCRVLKDIRKKELVFSDQVAAQFDFKNKDSLLLKDVLYNGNINFSESDTKPSSCKVYVIETEKHQFTIENCAKKATFKKVLYSSN